MDLGHRVRDLRNARHLSQIELAARAGVARNTLNRIENGHLMPTAPIIEHLAQALDVAPGALFEEHAARGVELTAQEWAWRQNARLHGMDSETWDDYLRAHDTVEELGKTWKEIYVESRRLHDALREHKRQRPQDHGRRQTLGRGLRDLRMHRYADLHALAMLLNDEDEAAEELEGEIIAAMREEASLMPNRWTGARPP
jgi:transcriptional regulator with XRE-family HTH domain